MISRKWNDSWKVTVPGASPLMEMVMGGDKAGDTICLPHDAMILEKRTQDTKNLHQTGFYSGGIYFYTKRFFVPLDWKDKKVTFEFEGVYMNAQVYVNGDYAGGCPNGYTNFYISADDYLKYGEDNTVKVIANNSAELNSRWYSGSGIYRNVNLILGNRLHIQTEGLRIATPEVDSVAATVTIATKIQNEEKVKRSVRVSVQLFDKEGKVVAGEQIPVTIFGGKTVTCHQRILVENPQLWSTEEPSLYTCQVQLIEEGNVVDEAVDAFGIRTLSLNAKQGLRINGKEVKLRGACIHHDNGVIGACTLERAEERRCQQLKAAGFNCIRSSHHPLSKAMLDACDREGMLVLDELSDIWTRSKNHNDAAAFFKDYWEYDVERMIAKDYNHPSVIMYVTGNEIQEAGTAKGAEWNRLIVNKIKDLDSTRYVTSAMNGLLAAMERMRDIMCHITGMTPEQFAEQMEAAQNPETQNIEGGSDGVNSMQAIMQGPMADAFACNPILTELLEEFTGSLDIAGYNYLTGRHVMDHDLNPNRVVLGTETFPSDIERLWNIVEENPHVIGDMTWTGYDYLGEAGIGIFYYDGRVGFNANWPSSIAYIGDIDIIGNRRSISYYREVVFGLRKEPYIAVERLNHYGKSPGKTPWMWKDCISSWTWTGYEGKPANVDVYSSADEVEVLLNGRSLGRKAAGRENHYMASYELSYEPGTLVAIGYENGTECGRYELISAGIAVELEAQADCYELEANGADLSYIMIGLKDEEGNPNLQIEKEIKISVEGAGTLQGFGSADPDTKNHYSETTWNTYDGYVLAVIRAGVEPGMITVKLSSEGCREKEIEIEVKS